jgi:hypothetical protein
MNAPDQLSPYQHELNGRGTRCAADCPACRWRKEELVRELSGVIRGWKPDWLNCELFRIGLEELGLA